MAKIDANPEMPKFVSDYHVAEVDPSYLLNAVKPKQFLHIDQSECIMCEGCVDICPWKCIHMVNVQSITDASSADLPSDDPRAHVAFIVDEDVCTRCALCVDRCPTGVIVLGKVSKDTAEGDPHMRTERHGYAYGVRF
ncbi:MAG: 4Fe-4S binding protein [Acidimicrobiia bacterium]